MKEGAVPTLQMLPRIEVVREEVGTWRSSTFFLLTTSREVLWRPGVPKSAENCKCVKLSCP
eukprot:6131840-Prorocentrum_lima.AAC.1